MPTLHKYLIMEDKSEELTLIATAIAIELIKDKTPQQTHEIRIILSQVLSTINTLCGLKK